MSPATREYDEAYNHSCERIQHSFTLDEIYCYVNRVEWSVLVSPTLKRILYSVGSFSKIYDNLYISKCGLINSFHTDPVFSHQNVNVVWLSDVVQFGKFWQFSMKIEGKTIQNYMA